MKKLVSITLLLFSFSLSFAQHFDEDGVELLVKCHSTEMEQKLLLDNPELRPLIEAAEAEQEEFLRNFVPNSGARDGEPYTIPVVFHIIHDFGPENISEAQVLDCIRVMNEDFNALNESINDVHPAFQDIVAGLNIRFALATRDPQGNCTNGITRSVSELTNEGGENLKDISPIWDRSRYMNIWVCNDIESGAAGYTYRPSSVNGSWGQSHDGIVVRADYVGSIGVSSVNRSHTMTHEVGHWLNLPHLWGSSNEPGLDSNCGMDDGVDDTPNTIGWTSCNVNGESCGSLDNVENYMEYAYCSKMFTQGQVARMEAALNSGVAQRSSLWQPSNLEFTGVNEEPIMCEIDFTSTERVICVGSSVDFSDYSYGGIEERIWTFEGGNPSTSDAVNQSVVYNTPGLYNVSLYTSDGVNSLELNEENYVRVIDTAYTNIPFAEGFEENVDFSNNESIWYTQGEETPEINWEITDAAAFSGNYSAYVHGRQNSNEATEYLYSQTFDLSGVTQEVGLTFKYACAPRFAASDDQLRVWISKDCGNFWSPRLTLSGDDLYTVSNNVSGEFVPNGQNEWVEKSIPNIVSVFWNSSFRIRFEFISGNGNNIYIDDINLVDLSTVTNVDDITKLKDEVKIYPNPATDIVTVEIGNMDEQESMEINLIDLSGRVITNVYEGSQSISNRRLQLSVSDLSSGIYFLEFKVPGGRFAEKVMVVD